ncbi:MAG: hypothetical protein R3A45_03010 [Bdellovibrionota bacterium]
MVQPVPLNIAQQIAYGGVRRATILDVVIDVSLSDTGAMMF